MPPPFRSLDDQAKPLAQSEKSRILVVSSRPSAGSNFLGRKRLASEGKRKLARVHRSPWQGRVAMRGRPLQINSYRFRLAPWTFRAIGFKIALLCEEQKKKFFTELPYL
jgi:hypothetical protein